MRMRMRMRMIKVWFRFQAEILRNQKKQQIGKEADPRQENTNDDNGKPRRTLKRNAQLISADKIKSDALTNISIQFDS
jgi:hypothetical protein